MLPYENEDEVIKTKKIKWHHWLLLNRPLKVIIALLLTTILVPVLIYQYLFFTSIDLPPSDGFSFGSCLIARQARLPCGYGDIPVDQCHSECCYDHTNDVCFHRFPSRFSYLLNEEWSEELTFTPRIATVPFGSQRSYTDIRLSIDEISSTHLSLTFYKSDTVIYGRKLVEKDYVYDVSHEELNVMVNAPQGTIFNTARGPFIASDDIWEMAFQITNETIYGLEEIPLKENTVKVIYSHKGGLSSIPLIYAKSNGSYHGLLIDTEAPTEINVRSENQIVIRSITNFGLKFHLFVGPNPADIMKDVTKLIGANNNFEYWMLGTHICTEDNIAFEPLEDLQSFISSARTHSLPFDSHCGVKPVVFNTDCDEEEVSLVNHAALALRSADKKFVPHISPYIRYDRQEIQEETDTEEEMHNVKEMYSNETVLCFDPDQHQEYLLKDPKSEYIYVGLVDEYNVIYPQYNKVDKEFMEILWVYRDFDGVVLENNWPLDESDKSVNETHLYLPYFNENLQEAFTNTPQWNSTRPERYLYTHNLYASEFIAAFDEIYAAPPIISTSQWMNGNVPINRQDIETSWSSLQRELVAASLGGISGHRLWSSPICGDTENFDKATQVRLCAKWYMAATYFPMINIHSKQNRRDPLAFIGTDRSHMISALRKRMNLLPYIYSVLQEGPLLRPMFYQFPSTVELANLTTQFSVGDDLLIVPNLQPSQSHVHFWVPPGQWYEFWGGLKIHKEVGEAKTMSTTEADFLTFIRGGSIVIKQEDVATTAAETRKISPYTLIIALHCETINVPEESEKVYTEDETTPTQTSEESSEESITTLPNNTECLAEGKLYMAPGMTILFEADANTLTITSEGQDFEIFCDISKFIWAKEVFYIKIYGLDEEKNNYDNYRNIVSEINLCDLQTIDHITLQLV